MKISRELSIPQVLRKVLRSWTSASIITLMSQSFTLYRLQEIDSKIDSANLRLDQIITLLNDQSALSDIKKQVKITSQTLQEARKALQLAENNVRDQQIKIQQSEAILYSGKVTNPKELQDISSELNALKRYYIVLQDRQLDTMIIMEEAENEHNSALNQMGSIQNSLTAEHKVLEIEQKSLEKDLTRLETERLAAVKSINADDLKFYNQLRNQKNGVAVAKVTGRNCMACGTTLTAALVQTAHSPNKLTRCSTCGRILYIG